MSENASALVGAARAVQEWTRERPMAADASIATFAAVLALAELQSGSQFDGRDLDLIGVVLALAGAGSLLWRRRAPLTTLAVATTALVAIYVREYGSFAAMIGLIAIYSVAAHGPDRRRAWTAIGAASIVLFVTASFTILAPTDGYRVGDALSMAVLLASAGAVGGIVRNRQEIFADARARAARAEAEQAAEAERAANRERVRIAREMHDVVAHGMSVIAVQAAAAQQIVHDDPDRAAEVMHNVEVTSREALDSLRRTLGVLRNGAEPGRTLSPQPDLGDVSRAVEQSTAAGIPTELTISGSVRDLPAGLELNAFRVIQEALTNVRKHAGTTATAEVLIDYGPETLTIDVTDDGSGLATSLGESGAGHGLVGMRERVELYGGSFSSGPRTGGGFKVQIEIPIGPHNSGVVAETSAQTTGSDGS